MNGYSIAGSSSAEKKKKIRGTYCPSCDLRNGPLGVRGECLLCWAGRAQSGRNGLLVGMWGGQPRDPRHGSSVLERRSNVAN